MLVHAQFGESDLCAVTWQWLLRRALLKLILCDHNLRVETGRYARPQLEREEQVCLACAKQGIRAIDDEHHALDECSVLGSFGADFWEAVCTNHVGSEWRQVGVTNLLRSLGGFDLRV